MTIGDNNTRQASDMADDPIGRYKRLLRSFLDRRPSGTRQRIATAIGTHRSFISQITNPGYRVPLPAQHVATIMAVCHFSPDERAEFLAAYDEAHPGQLADVTGPQLDIDAPNADTAATAGATGGVWIPLPAFPSQELTARVARAIHTAANAIIALAEASQTHTDLSRRDSDDDPH